LTGNKNVFFQLQLEETNLCPGNKSACTHTQSLSVFATSVAENAMYKKREKIPIYRATQIVKVANSKQAKFVSMEQTQNF